jgi:hypothetical protein
MWFCLGYGWLYYHTEKLNSTSFTDQLLLSMLHGAINIEPVNIFMYTWRFLETLESEQKGSLRQATKWFRIISVWLVPLVYLALGVALLLANANSAVAFYEGN